MIIAKCLSLLQYSTTVSKKVPWGWFHSASMGCAIIDSFVGFNLEFACTADLCKNNYHLQMSQPSSNIVYSYMSALLSLLSSIVQRLSPEIVHFVNKAPDLHVAKTSWDKTIQIWRHRKKGHNMTSYRTQDFSCFTPAVFIWPLWHCPRPGTANCQV